MFLNVCKQIFHISKVRISQKVKRDIMLNLRDTIFYIKANVLQDSHICICVLLIFLFKTSLSRLISKLSFILRQYLWCPYAKMVNWWRDGMLLQIKSWSQIQLSFDDLTYLKAKEDITIWYPDLTFNCLPVSR